MSHPQEVSLARLLRVYESKLVSSSGRGEVGGSSREGESRHTDGTGSDASVDGVLTIEGLRTQNTVGNIPTTDGAAADGMPSNLKAINVHRPPVDAKTSAAKARQHLEAMKSFLNQVKSLNPDVYDVYSERVDKIGAWIVSLEETSSEDTEYATVGVRESASPRVRQSAPSRRSTDVDRTSEVEVEEDTVDAIPSDTKTSTAQRPTTSFTPTNGAISLNIARSSSKSNASQKVKQRTRSDGGAKLVLSDKAEATLRQHRMTQDHLSDDLVSLAGAIRENAGAMERSLFESRKGLESLESELNRNVTSVKTATYKQKQLKKTFTSFGCWTWVVLFLVGVVFSWTFVFIRITSDKIAKIK